MYKCYLFNKIKFKLSRIENVRKDDRYTLGITIAICLWYLIATAFINVRILQNHTADYFVTVSTSA